MSNAIDSWSWPGCQGMSAHVEVYARAATIILSINGREVGHARLGGNCRTIFHVAYQPGVIEAAAYDSQGRLIGRHSLHSASSNTQLRLEPEEDRVAAGHLAFVRVRYTDERGIGKPLQRGHLRARLDSGGDLLGFGCAAPYNPGSFVTGQTRTYYGEALAVIRAGSQRQADLRLSVTDGRYHSRLSIPIV